MAVTNDNFQKARDDYNPRKFGKRDLGLLNRFTQTWFDQQAKDPYSAIGALIGYGLGEYLGDKEYNRQQEKAAQAEEAMKNQSVFDTANQMAKDSGYVGQDSADLIMAQKDIYNQNKPIYDDLLTRVQNYEGDKEGEEYKSLARELYNVKTNMDNANALANNLRHYRTQNGLSNEGLYASDNTLREKLGDVSMLSPIGGQTKAPTITDMANNALVQLGSNTPNTLGQFNANTPNGVITQEGLSNFYMVNPDLKKKILDDYETQKRSPSYWKNLKRELQKQGLSETVIDDYVDRQGQAVADSLLNDYYRYIAEGKYLAADAMATEMANIDPTLGQLLKTGGVSVNNLFGADQNRLNTLAQWEHNAQVQALKDAKDDARYQRNRQDKITDAITTEQWKQKLGLGKYSKEGKDGKEEKLSAGATQVKNILGQGAVYFRGGNLDAAYDAVNDAKNLLWHDDEFKGKLSGSELNEFNKAVATLELRILEAMANNGEDINPEYWNDVKAMAGD